MLVDVAQSSFGAEKFLISYFEHPTPFLAAWALPSGCIRGLTSASGQRELAPSSRGLFRAHPGAVERGQSSFCWWLKNRALSLTSSPLKNINGEVMG